MLGLVGGAPGGETPRVTQASGCKTLASFCFCGATPYACRIRVVRALLSAGADIYGAVPHIGTPLRIVCLAPSPPLKRLVRKFLAHRMRATARHWWLPWPLACHVAGFLV